MRHADIVDPTLERGLVLTGGVKLGGCDNFAVDGSERGGDDL